MRSPALLAIILPASLAFAQDEDGGDAHLRALTSAAPDITMQRVELHIEPALEIASVSGMTADANGNLYILQRGNAADPIIVTDSKGKLLRSFGSGLFKRPHSIRIDASGDVWTVDSNTSMVYKFSPNGDKLLEISVGSIPDPNNDSCAASDIAFGANGHIYVADGYCNARILEYDASGDKVREWGTPGTGPGEFNLPHSVAVGPNGNVYVADRENGRVQQFTPQGEFVEQWRFGGRVLSVTFASDGEMYLSAEPKNAEPQKEATLLHVDRRSGAVLGKIEDFGHEISVGADGTLMPASLTDRITIYRR